jgi:UDP:flavonoid glycosyltransferase YjiC (YdhE family)
MEQLVQAARQYTDGAGRADQRRPLDRERIREALLDALGDQGQQACIEALQAARVEQDGVRVSASDARLDGKQELAQVFGVGPTPYCARPE